MSNNRIRVLAEVLSIDAWHAPFRDDGQTSSVHVEVSFQNGRLGGADEKWPFTFKISLKRALLTVRLEEPLTIDRASVARPKPISEAERSIIGEVRNAAKFDVEAKGKVTPSAFSLGVSGSSKIDSETSTAETMRVVQHIPQIVVTPRPGGGSAYSWELTPGHGELLSGQPWDPVEEPRFCVKSVNKEWKIEPTINVTLACAFEDIEITELQLKRDKLLDRAKEVVYNEMNMAAAVQFLKISLKSADLEVGSIDNRFSDILLAELLSVAA